MRFLIQTTFTEAIIFRMTKAISLLNVRNVGMTYQNFVLFSLAVTIEMPTVFFSFACILVKVSLAWSFFLSFILFFVRSFSLHLFPHCFSFLPLVLVAFSIFLWLSFLPFLFPLLHSQVGIALLAWERYSLRDREIESPCLFFPFVLVNRIFCRLVFLDSIITSFEASRGRKWNDLKLEMT